MVPKSSSLPKPVKRSEGMKYIIELTSNSWVADWEGDPGRTIVMQNAKIFDCKEEAKMFLLNILKDNPHRNYFGASVRKIEILLTKTS